MPKTSKPATMDDVAKAANVSRNTVSRVINEAKYVKPETREKVLSVIKSLNYYPNAIAKSLTNNTLNTLAVVFAEQTSIFSHSYFMHLLQGIEAGCRKHNFDIFISTKNMEEDQDYKSLFFERKADGLLVIAPSKKDKRLNQMIKHNVPFVVINSRFDDKQVSYVDGDNAMGMMMAVDYLYRLGHRDIGYIGGPKDNANSEDRAAGFLQGMAKHKLTINKKWVKSGLFHHETGMEKGLELISKRQRPSAIICANDFIAMGLLMAAQKKNVAIPDELSIMGFDDLSQEYHPLLGITSLRQPFEEIGKKAVDMLLDIIRGKGKARKELFKLSIVERQSCRGVSHPDIS